MLTIDEIRAVPLFSALAATELELIRMTSADIHLGAGEYAVHEGETERVLFAVLSGKMEVLRSFDGVERTLGWRTSELFKASRSRGQGTCSRICS